MSDPKTQYRRRDAIWLAIGHFGCAIANGLLPLDVYDRRNDPQRYFDACDAGRIYKDYAPLAKLVTEWEAAALTRWRGDGQT